MKEQRIVVVDGSPLLWRAAAVFPELHASGKPSGVIFGALRNLITGIRDTKATSLVVVWDQHKFVGEGQRVLRSRWRQELYPNYKFRRELPAGPLKPGAPPEIPYHLIKPQIEAFRQLLEFAGIRQIGIPGVEADDLAGLLVSGIEELYPKANVVMLTTDADWWQLMRRETTTFFEAVQRKHWDRSDVSEKLKGFGPERQNELRAFSGDGGDDIPGIPGIAQSRAGLLLERYGTVDAVLSEAAIPWLRTKHWAKPLVDPELRAHSIATIRMAQQLVTIPTIDRHDQLSADELLLFGEQAGSPTPQPQRSSLVGLCDAWGIDPSRKATLVDELMLEPLDISGLRFALRVNSVKTCCSDSQAINTSCQS